MKDDKKKLEEMSSEELLKLYNGQDESEKHDTTYHVQTYSDGCC